MNIAENRKRIKALREYAQAIADQLPSRYARGVHVRNGIVTLNACRVYGDGIWLRWNKDNVMTGHFRHPSLCGEPMTITSAIDLTHALKMLTGETDTLFTIQGRYDYFGTFSTKDDALAALLRIRKHHPEIPLHAIPLPANVSPKPLHPGYLKGN